jgi:phosphoserine phosphatase RsbU/P
MNLWAGLHQVRTSGSDRLLHLSNLRTLHRQTKKGRGNRSGFFLRLSAAPAIPNRKQGSQNPLIFSTFRTALPMQSIIKRIFGFGVTEGMPFRLQNKIRIFNAASVSICVINLAYAIVGFAIGWHLAAVVSLVSILFLGFGWMLIVKKKYIQTFHIVMAYAYGFLLSYSYLFGESTQSHLFFMFVPVASTIMFEQRKTMYFYFVLTLCAIIGAKLMFSFSQPYYSTNKDMLWLFGYLNSCFAAYLIFIGVSVFKKENQNYADEVELTKQAIEEKNKEITDSINYAGRIQKAIVPAEEEVKACFPDAFILLKPKDIVSGDFYWISKKGEHIFFALADCTGHGVPGGFMTMLGVSFLDEIVNEKNISDPAAILDLLREKIITSLKQTGATGENKDGMDLVLCDFDLAEKKLSFAGANNSLYLFRNETLTEFKTDKQPCGFYHKPFAFTRKEINLQQHDVIYLFTDGFPDQFGGLKGKKFKYRQLEEKIIKYRKHPMAEQKDMLNQEFENWRENYEQVDDVLLAGISTN